MSTRPQRLKEALDELRQALEGFESALVEFEEALQGEEQERPQTRKGLDLLSIPEVCQEIGMGKSWVYRRIQSGEIPSIKLGHNVKVKREDLHQYLESQRQKLVSEKPPLGSSVNKRVVAGSKNAQSNASCNNML
jgi:excisionase family DNA binding protein